MNSRRIFFVMVGVMVLLIAAGIGGVVVGNKLFQKQSKQLIDLKLEDKLIREQETALIQANKDISKYSDLEKVAKAIVPQDKDQAEAIREITKIAESSGIGIASVTFPVSNLGQNSKPAEGGSTAPTSVLTQVKPVEGITGVYSLELVVQPDSTAIPYNQFIDFLSKLERNRRTAQITQISINPEADSNRLNFEVTLNIYIKP